MNKNFKELSYFYHRIRVKERNMAVGFISTALLTFGILYMFLKVGDKMDNYGLLAILSVLSLSSLYLALGVVLIDYIKLSYNVVYLTKSDYVKWTGNNLHEVITFVGDEKNGIRMEDNYLLISSKGMSIKLNDYIAKHNNGYKVITMDL